MTHHQTSSRSDALGTLRHDPALCNACIYNMWFHRQMYLSCVVLLNLYKHSNSDQFYHGQSQLKEGETMIHL